MNEKKYMLVDGMPIELEGEKNLLAVIRKAGIELPTFCYYSELSIYGACRMCMIETERGGLEAACSAEPRAGMSIKTNTARLRKYRKNILELLLANHCRDCTTCEKSGSCKLQDLAKRFNVNQVRFTNTHSTKPLDTSSPCITREESKCILCGDCVRMCSEIQNVGAIDYSHRSSHSAISTAFDVPLAESPCVGCGQCAAVCPTGALVVRNDLDKVYAALDKKDAKVTVQIAPAVRVAVGRELGLPENEMAMGKIVAALHRLGFAEVFDTTLGADLTVIEESEEFLKHVTDGHELPLFTSCCPAWVQYCEKNYPSLMEHVSSCKSPMQMFAALLKDQGQYASRNQFHVAIMPCTAKKFEAARDEFKHDGAPDVDAVLTTQELIRMIVDSGIVFDELEPEAIDIPFGTVSGAGVIFGVTGGVTEAVLRRVSSDKSRAALISAANTGIRGMEGVKIATVKYGDADIRIAVVSGLNNASKLIDKIISGEEKFHFVEVMACPGGCVCGAGQPVASYEQKLKRSKQLYAYDQISSIKRSEENPLALSLYDEVLKGRVHELLHVHYAHAHKEAE